MVALKVAAALMWESLVCHKRSTRAEYWGVMQASQAFSGTDSGTDNLTVLSSVAPLFLVEDGDTLVTIHSMPFSKVFCHVGQAMVDG